MMVRRLMGYVFIKYFSCERGASMCQAHVADGGGGVTIVIINVIISNIIVTYYCYYRYIYQVCMYYCYRCHHSRGIGPSGGPKGPDTLHTWYNKIGNTTAA